MTLNKNAFTLIELLAVITILGILMLVAIPAVTRTIENSRRNTFLTMAQQYAKEVKTQWLSDKIVCTLASEKVPASSVPGGEKVSIPIDTMENDTAAGSYSEYNALGYKNASALMDKGGKSSWGNKNVKGYVTVEISSDPGSQKYYIQLIDENNRGIVHDSRTPILFNKLVKSNVKDKTERSFKDAYYNMTLSICEVIEE